jgi:hypothetical protein
MRGVRCRYRRPVCRRRHEHFGPTLDGALGRWKPVECSLLHPRPISDGQVASVSQRAFPSVIRIWSARCTTICSAVIRPMMVAHQVGRVRGGRERPCGRHHRTACASSLSVPGSQYTARQHRGLAQSWGRDFAVSAHDRSRGEPVVLEVTGPPGSQEFLDAMIDPAPEVASNPATASESQRRTPTGPASGQTGRTCSRGMGVSAAAMRSWTGLTPRAFRDAQRGRCALRAAQSCVAAGRV